MTRSTATTYGLAICALLGVVDIISLAGLGSDADDGPPVLVVLIGAVLGVITLVGARMAWRGGRSGVVTVIVSRVLSALLALPAFFVDDVPDWVPPVVGIFVVLTLVGVGLLVVSLRRRESSAA
ncbi:MAG: hypothetical protein M3417_01665 [Actinomycetota bacterium]|nr:hypothetical protein [Actinomycetota bacterium]